MKRLATTMVAFLAAASPLAAAESIYELIDTSEGYFTLAPGVVVIEGEDDVVVCKMEVDPDVFDTYAKGGDVSPGDLTAICIPLEEFDN